MSESVAAVVVTFNPDKGLLLRALNEAARQVDIVIVVDNGSSRSPSNWFDESPFKRKFDPIELGYNYGVAYAHNRGIERAMHLGSQFVLLLDQDSIPQSGMVETLLRAIELRRSEGVKIAAAGPRWVDPGTGAEGSFLNFDEGRVRRLSCRDRTEESLPVLADFLISSGSLIPIQSLRVIGLMCEELFIDHVDTEWFLRAKSIGYRALGVCDAVMEHHLGNDAVRVAWRRQRFIPVHSSLRLYYMVRNSLILYKRSYVSRAWMLFDLKRLVFIIAFYGFFRAPRLRNVAMMIKGLVDGSRGKSGKFRGT